MKKFSFLFRNSAIGGREDQSAAPHFGALFPPRNGRNATIKIRYTSKHAFLGLHGNDASFPTGIKAFLNIPATSR